MQRVIALGIIFVIAGSHAAESRGLGKFLGRLLAREAVAGAMRSSPQIKTNSSDTLTVNQLVRCLKKASALDEESEFIAAKRSELQSARKDMDARKSKLEMKGALLDLNSQLQVDDFSAEVDAHNASVERLKSHEDDFNRFVNLHNGLVNFFDAECAKRYFADDMATARKLAGL
jgi:hypothetical protein